MLISLTVLFFQFLQCMIRMSWLSRRLGRRLGLQNIKSFSAGRNQVLEKLDIDRLLPAKHQNLWGGALTSRRNSGRRLLPRTPPRAGTDIVQLWLRAERCGSTAVELWMWKHGRTSTSVSAIWMWVKTLYPQWTSRLMVIPYTRWLVGFDPYPYSVIKSDHVVQDLQMAGGWLHTRFFRVRCTPVRAGGTRFGASSQRKYLTWAQCFVSLVSCVSCDVRCMVIAWLLSGFALLFYLSLTLLV